MAEALTGERIGQVLSREMLVNSRVPTPWVMRKATPAESLSRDTFGLPVLEDKIVQRAVVAVLNEVYGLEFLGFSYGFRLERNQHQALDALYVGIMTKKVSWVLDADIRTFFDTLAHEWKAINVRRHKRLS